MDFEALTARLELEAQSLKEKIAVASHRLSEIETFLALGKKLAERHDVTHGVGSANSLFDSLATDYTMATRKDRVLNAAEKILRDGKRRATKELLLELESVGVLPGGSEPVQTLSTYLSREKERFSSDVRRGGWTLRSYDQMNAVSHSGPTPHVSEIARLLATKLTYKG